MTFGDYAVRYLGWAKDQHRSYSTTRGQVEAFREAFRDMRLDEVAPSDVEAFLAKLRAGCSPSGRKLAPATINRYRDRLSGMFPEVRELVSDNPVRRIRKTKEPGGRIVYLPPAKENRPAYEDCAGRSR